MSNALDITLLPLGLQSASGEGAAIDIVDVDSGLPLRTTLVLSVNVTAITGTDPQLTITVETSGALTGPWRVVESLDEVLNENSTDSYPMLVGDCKRFVRVAWTIGGTDTPGFTFGVSGNAQVTYADRQDMINYGMSAAVLDQISEDMKLRALVAASAEMSTNLSVSFTLPITAWGEDVTKHTAILAVWTAVSGNFREGVDQTLIDLKDDTMAFLRRIGDGRLRPKTIIDSTPEVQEDSVVVASLPSRNWNAP